MKKLLVLLLLITASLATAAEPIRVACVGDSITFGAGVEDREKNCYPKVLGDLLGEGYDVRNFGVSGATLLKEGDKPYWKEGKFKEATDFNPNIVIIKLGTNDTKPQNWAHKDQFEADTKALVEHFRGLPAKPEIYLCHPVPAYPGNWGINDATIKKEVVPLVDAAAKETKSKVIDLYKALSRKPGMFPDKVHPNAAGAKVIAETVFKAVQK